MNEVLSLIKVNLKNIINMSLGEEKRNKKVLGIVLMFTLFSAST